MKRLEAIEPASLLILLQLACGVGVHAAVRDETATVEEVHETIFRWLSRQSNEKKRGGEQARRRAKKNPDKHEHGDTTVSPSLPLSLPVFPHL